MNEEDDSSCSKEIKSNINKPSISIFLIIITGLFIISFCTSFFSLISLNIFININFKKNVYFYYIRKR